MAESMTRRRNKERPPRPPPDPTQPNAAESAMYVAGDEFRGTAVRLYAQRVLVSEPQAEERIRKHLADLGMSPEPGNHPTPLYEKVN
jgi:hypothetical protein